MNTIISKLYTLIHQTDNLIDFEESVRIFMYEVFASMLGDVFTNMNTVIVKEKQAEDWTVERNDEREVQFTFGVVRYTHTLMYDLEGNAHYPFDEWAGFKKYQRRSPFVEVKVAEMAAESTYRETAHILKEWTAVDISHTTVGSIVKKVGEAQAKADEGMVIELEESAELPEGKEVGFLYAEADGVFVRGTEKKKSHEVSHAILYEGWDKNGKRVSLRNPTAIMTIQPTANFWKEVQALTAHHYSLEKTQVVTNSDAGAGYTAEKFQEAFSQSEHPVINQLDSYHVFQELNRALGAAKSEYKDEIRKALKEHDLDHFNLWLDTYESTLEDAKKLKKVREFRSYILNNWDRIIDWREYVDNPPKDGRSLGAMESNQRHITYRMKKRGMHWSADGAEAMVKVKQGKLNGTLRKAYLKDLHRSTRKQRELKKVVRMSTYLRQPSRPSIGTKQGDIAVYAPHSSAIGNLAKNFK
ncbi:ISLre2 family transposase [Amphibacillus sp. MSJ-3]|uniref:ISLre2 family transposase n=1 Tax=Amphibacillus sp. MSJ-3 TaxID=2841505 RepID=UPI001C0F3076|nr:ISLre2 family transposase [Amphibacillus sp. MSJ-3]MBU5594541.1 ISLre2 family transposase [Amphibacillus sp. MSJ-3]